MPPAANRLPPAPDFQLPPRGRTPGRREALALAASVAAHVALVGLIAAGTRSFAAQGFVQRVLLLPAPEETIRVESLPPTPRGAPAPIPALRLLPFSPGVAARTDAAAAAPAAAPESAAVAGAPATPAPDSLVARPGRGRLPPALASGELWVRPLPAVPQELAQRLQRTTAELGDSIVTATVQAYLDSIAKEPGAAGMALPEWTTELGGKKFGLDEQYIYVAGIKIPAILLALLPLPDAGNYDRNKAYSHLMDIRRDIYQAAARADNMAEFKSYVKEIRERKERERQFREALRQAPDSVPDAPLP